jgi:hypothetical protein
VSNLIPLTIESLVALLLLVTILYCVRLNAQLKRLRADETVMRTTIAELTIASESAERAILGLKQTVREADDTLGERLRTAERFCAEIARHTEAGNELINRLMQVSSVRAALKGEGPLPAGEPKPAPDPKAIVAAAQAFTERARARVKDRAA